MRKTEKDRTPEKDGKNRKAGKSRKARRSLYTYIIRVFVILVSVDILLALALLASYRVIRRTTEPVTISERVSRQLPLLKSGAYDKLALKKYLGRGGYYEIVSSGAKILYTSKASEKNSYSKMVLTLIPDMNEDTYVFAIPLEDKYGTGYIIGRVQTEYSGDDVYNVLKGLLVVNGERYIDYSTLQYNGENITERDLKYILETSDVNESGDYILQKYAFRGNDGAKRYLVIHSPVGRDTKTAREGRLATLAILIFSAGVLASILIAAVLIVRKIRKPLRKLNSAMNSFAGGTWESVDVDAGLKEFDNALTTFNRMEEELHKSEDERRELEDQRRKMLADISHDLKTPITVIRGYLEAMQDGLIPPSEQEKYLKIMTEKTELMGSLITSFSEYSRLEHPEFRFTFQEGDLAEYLREYMAKRYEELEIAGYGVDIRIPEAPVPASFDAEQLKRVFENIISNALKYTEPGTTIFCSLETVSGPDGRKARICLGDNGRGMPEELKKDAFQPFVTGDASRKSGQGTGLGLSIARKIVEGHHGRIRILPEAEWKPGTMYEILLPVL